ncbi:MAG: hypothetical protein SVK08_00675 [Halobacteriota archaeon]|nr:hypothetical protein [Halobacteriota archaeon]
MIFQPYEVVGLNDGNLIEDCLEGGERISIFVTDDEYFNETIGFWNSSCKEIASFGGKQAMLKVNADEGIIPMIVEECGYEWEPVYTRRL